MITYGLRFLMAYFVQPLNYNAKKLAAVSILSLNLCKPLLFKYHWLMAYSKIGFPVSQSIGCSESNDFFSGVTALYLDFSACSFTDNSSYS